MNEKVPKFKKGLPGLAISLMLCFWLSGLALSAQNIDVKKVGIGVLLDSKDAGVLEVWTQTEEELTALLRNSADMRVVDVLSADWSAEKARSHYQSLVANPQVDLLITIGAVSGAVIAQANAYPKPVVAMGVYDPSTQTTTIEKTGNTGVKNLSFVLLNSPIERDLIYFREVYPFKKVALVYTRALEGLLSLQQQLISQEPRLKGVSTKLVFAETDPLTTVANMPEDVDAVYFGFIPGYTPAQWRTMMEAVNKRKLPSFSWNLENLEYGVMASNSTETDIKKLARRIALNVEAILSGTDAGELPTLFDFDERLTLNGKTMRLVGFYAPWDVLSRAEIIEDDLDDANRQIDLSDVFFEAQTRSLRIRQAARDLEVSRTDLDLVKGQLRPSVDVSASGSKIDSDRAKASQGSQSENTISSGVQIQQLLFSESTNAAKDLQTAQVEAVNYQNKQLALDVALDASLAYLDVLRGRAQIEIRKQDLQQTRRNLEISKQREKVGYSGRSDVYRWESQVATTNQQVIQARVQYYLAQSQLNRLLNRPQNLEFRIKEGETTEQKLGAFYEEGFANYLKTPQDLEVLMAFLTKESRELLPEIKALEASMTAQKRQLLSDRRARYAPTVALQGQSDYLLSRSGAGSSSALPATPEDLSWSAALNVSLPLFRGGNLRRQISKSNIQLQGLELQYEDLLQALELAIRFQLGELVNTYFNIGSSQRASDLADQSLELVKDGYAKGTLPIAQLLDAQLAATNASEAAAIAEWDYVAAILRLERAVGRFSLTDSENQKAQDLREFLEFSKQFNNQNP